MKQKRNCAIILAAGKGKRMGTDIPKQYIEINGYPILYYTIRAFEESFIDEIILVTGKGEEDFCKEKIVDKYNFNKVKAIVPGGKERYDSVYMGLQQVENAEYVFIHDGARPFVTNEILERMQQSVEKYNACVVGVPVKDTIKMVNKQNIITDTPDRSCVWAVQTPQVFKTELIKEAYNKIRSGQYKNITDDAMVLEQTMDYPIQMVEGSYKNIKITTLEDLEIARLYL